MKNGEIRPRVTQPRTMDDGPYLWISHAAAIRTRSAAGANGLAVMMALAARAPIDGGPFKASANNLAEGSALAVRTVRKILPILAQARLIRIESGRGRGLDGGDTANTFLLLRVNLAFHEGGGCAPCSPPVHNVQPPLHLKPVSFAEERETSAERQREVSTPSAPALALAGPGRGVDDKTPQRERLDDEW